MVCGAFETGVVYMMQSTGIFGVEDWVFRLHAVGLSESTYGTECGGQITFVNDACNTALPFQNEH